MTAFTDRIGLAIARPRLALELAGDRQHAGRACSDLIAALSIALVATQLRWIVSAVWLGAAVDPELGLRAFLHIMMRTFTVDLAVLTTTAVAIWLLPGRTRELGRAFDLACAAFLPVVAVRVVSQVVVEVSGQIPSATVRHVADGIAYSWLLALVVFAIALCRRGLTAPKQVEPTVGRRASWVMVAPALVGLALQVVWLASHVNDVRPLVSGAVAPPLGLMRIGPFGPVGTPVAIEGGKVTVVEFWATWCKPCRKSLPKLNAIVERFPDVQVVAVNLDDPVAARALFDAAHYTMTLVADDGAASERYGVTSIPHTVVIDPSGRVRAVARGTGLDLEGEITAASADPL